MACGLMRLRRSQGAFRADGTHGILAQSNNVVEVNAYGRTVPPTPSLFPESLPQSRPSDRIPAPKTPCGYCRTNAAWGLKRNADQKVMKTISRIALLFAIASLGGAFVALSSYSDGADNMYLMGNGSHRLRVWRGVELGQLGACLFSVLFFSIIHYATRRWLMSLSASVTAQRDDVPDSGSNAIPASQRHRPASGDL
jgi:hypothetical protein